MTINERIKLVRKDRGLTLVEFGGMVGYNNATLSMIENGKKSYATKVDEKLIKAIVNSFSVNEEWLRTGNGDMYLTRERPTEEERRSRARWILSIYASLPPDTQEEILRIAEEIVGFGEKKKEAGSGANESPEERPGDNTAIPYRRAG